MDGNGGQGGMDEHAIGALLLDPLQKDKQFVATLRASESAGGAGAGAGAESL